MRRTAALGRRRPGALIVTTALAASLLVAVTGEPAGGQPAAEPPVPEVPAPQPRPRDPAGAAGEVSLSIDFAGFAEAYGADWAGRARLIAVPECALTTPEVLACQERREVPTRYEPTAKRLAVDAVPAATATDASGGPVPGGSPEPEPGPPPSPSSTTTSTTATPGPNTTTTVATTTSPSTATSDAEPSPTTTATTEAASSGGQAGTRPSSDVPGTSAPGATTTTVPPSGPAAVPPGDNADTDGETDPGVDERLAPAQAGGVVYVLSAGPNSLQGDFRATPFSPSGSWVTDLSSGGSRGPTPSPPLRLQRALGRTSRCVTPPSRSTG